MERPGLVISVVFADEESRQPSDNHLRPREPHHANHFFESSPMVPRRQRLQYVLAGSVTSPEKPDIVDPKFRQRMTQFHLAHRSERRRPLRPHIVMTSFAVGHVDSSHAFVLIEKLSQISRYSGFIVWMRDHQENICLQPIVWLANWLRLGCLCDERRQQKWKCANGI